MKIIVKPGRVLVSISLEKYKEQDAIKYPKKASRKIDDIKWTVEQVGSDVANFGTNFPVQHGSYVSINRSYSDTSVIEMGDKMYCILKPDGIQALFH